MIGRTNAGGGAGGGLNFKVVGGTSTPASPKENTIWVNTDTKITSWHFGVDEPNVCQATVPDAGDPWTLSISHTLHEGDILNFTIPATVSSTFEAIRMYDGSGKLYYVRAFGGAAVTGWSAGTKVGLVVSNTSYPIGNWGSDGGSARLYKWGDYYHNEGTVWITTGKSSTAPFNALKKNNITVYPISAKQYVSGAWADKTAKIYQNGAWADWWDGELYDNGNQFTGVTGGWGIHNYITDSRPLMAAEHKSDQMFFQAQNDYKVLMGIGNPVDLSNVNQIRFTGKLIRRFVYNGAIYALHLDVLKTKDLTSKVAGMFMGTEEVFDYTLDVSQFTGEHYVIIWADSNANIQGYITGVYLN